MKAFLALAALSLVQAAPEGCPLTDEQIWSSDSAVADQVRPTPIDSVDGGLTYLGFKPEYVACESCSNSWTSGFGRSYNYNYAWNSEVAMRSFHEDTGKGWNKKTKWYKSCPGFYEKDSWFSWSPKCVIPKDTKFLGETCESKSQCDSDFVKGYVDTTCAPTNNDESDPQWKCVLDEDSGMVSPYANTCSCFGLIWCESSDCNGNQCVLSTMDMKKHCKYADEDPFFGTSCSNCRASENSCKAWGGADPSTVDTSSVGIGAGVVGLGCVGLVGGVAMNRKRKLKQANKDSQESLELTAGGAGAV